MLKKKGLWQGLTLVFVMLFALAITAGLVMENYNTQLDSALGTVSEVLVTEEADAYGFFKPSEDVLNEDGSLNSQNLVKKLIDYGRRQAGEGVVLLKNEGNVLPLKPDTVKNITLLGARSHMTLQGEGMGMPIAGPVITLEDALGGTATDFKNNAKWSTNNNAFANMDNYNFTDVGGAGPQYNLNPTMIENYTYLNSNAGKGSRRVLSFKDSVGNFSQNPNEPSIAEIEAYDPDFRDSFASYHDAAIVVIGRAGSESNDYLPGTVAAGLGNTEPLELTTNERDVIKLATDNFDKVVVLLNTTSAMEVGEIQNNSKVDSILWIGHCGNYGTLGIADVISGKISPSGGLYDIYAAKGMSHPAMQNMGAFAFSNYIVSGRSVSPDSPIQRTKSRYYCIEPESIYVGYRYYETRYNDIVYKQNNADSTKGAVASTGNWRYNEEVVYPFGYGLSYTTFEQEIVGAPVFRREGHVFTMDITVKVTNTGSVAGKSIIQVYGQAPWKKGGAEKSAIQLINYDKTGVLAAGASETKTIHVDLQNIATYDMEHVNKDGSKGCWILDSGDYYFTIGNGSHEAMNNVLAAQGKTVADGMDAAGDGSAKKVYKYTYNSAYGACDDITFGISKNNTQVSNHLEYADWNYYEPGKITHLTRSDWVGTYPVKYENLEAPASMIDHLNGKYYTVKTDEDTSDILFGQDNGRKFYEMAFLEYDDAGWKSLLEQVSLVDAMGMLACCGNKFRDMPSIGFATGSYTENSGNGVALTLSSSRVDGTPWQCKPDDNNAGWHLEVLGCAPMVATSFNPDLQFELGEMVGLEALIVQLPILWGPGLNTHRHPYNGRNGDYYSEDPVLSGRIAEEFAIGALKYGLIAAPKHFAFNDQETQRNGIAPFLDEQRAREIELRAFQIAVEAEKYNQQAPSYWKGSADHHFGMLGLMTSFSKIGAVECTCSRGLLTDILKSEWGFHGYAVSDISDDFDLFTGLGYAGMTGYDVRSGYQASGFTKYQSMFDGVVPSEELYQGDRTMLLQFKEVAHNLLYAFCQSNLMNIYNSSTHKETRMTWWRGTYIGFEIGFGVLALAACALFILSVLKTKEV